MTRSKPKLGEFLSGRRSFREHMAARKKHLGPTRAQRIAKAPREPRGPTVAYLKVMRGFVADLDAMVQREIIPALTSSPSFVGGVQAPRPMVHAPDLRGDAQGCPEDAHAPRAGTETQRKGVVGDWCGVQPISSMTFVIS